MNFPMQQWYPYQQRHIWECYMRWTLAYRSFSTQLMRWKEFHFSKNLGRKVYIIVVEIVKPFSVSVHVSNLLIHGSDWYLLEPICVISYCNEQDFFTTVWILWLVLMSIRDPLKHYTTTLPQTCHHLLYQLILGLPIVNIHVYPGRLTWNLKMMVWKMIFLFNWVVFRFHVNLPGVYIQCFLFVSFLCVCVCVNPKCVWGGGGGRGTATKCLETHHTQKRYEVLQFFLKQENTLHFS